MTRMLRLGGPSTCSAASSWGARLWPLTMPLLLLLLLPAAALGAGRAAACCSTLFTRSVTTWWRFFDIQEILPPGAIAGIAVEAAEAPVGTTRSGETDFSATSKEWRLVLRLSDGAVREVQRSPGRASLDEKAAALRGALKLP